MSQGATITPEAEPEVVVKTPEVEAPAVPSDKVPPKKHARTIFVCGSDEDQTTINAQIGDGCIRVDLAAPSGSMQEQPVVFVRTSLETGQMTDWTAIS